MRTWTPEAKKTQSEAIRRWRPWQNSTGPKTTEGKKRAAINATKHGLYSQNMRTILAIFKRQRLYLKAFRQSLRLPKIGERTIMIPDLDKEGYEILCAFCDIPDLINIPRPRRR